MSGSGFYARCVCKEIGQKLYVIKKKEILKVIIILEHTILPDLYTYLHVHKTFYPF
jgi:hypothetical protein